MKLKYLLQTQWANFKVTKLGSNHPWSRKIRNCSNKGRGVASLEMKCTQNTARGRKALMENDVYALA